MVIKKSGFKSIFTKSYFNKYLTLLIVAYMASHLFLLYHDRFLSPIQIELRIYLYLFFNIVFLLSTFYFILNHHKKKEIINIKSKQEQNKFFMQLIHSQMSPREAIDQIIKKTKETTNVDDIGIRLKKTCAKNIKDETDSNCLVKNMIHYYGNLCVCDSILGHQTQFPHSQYIKVTPYGSFLSNNIRKSIQVILDNIGNQFESPNTVNNDVTEEHSILLIPLNYQGELVGLLQLYKKNKNYFTDEIVGHFEEMAKTMGFVLEQLKIQKELKNKKEMLQIIMENNPSLIAMFDSNMRYLYANKNWIFHFNLNKDNTIGQSFYTTYPHPIPEHLKDVFERVRQGHTEKSDEDILRYKSGGYDWVQWKIIPWYISANSVGGVIYIIDIVTDIKKEKIKHEKIFKYSNDLFCVIDFDGHFKQINPAFSNILGWSESELIDHSFLQFIHPDDIKKTQDIFKQVLNDKNKYFFENRYLCKNGEYKWLSWSSITFLQEKEIYGIARDVTSRKTIDKELLKLKQSAESANKSKSEIIASISHELRTPLSAIIGFTDLLSNENDSQKAQYYIELIRNNGQHLLHIINDILDISKIDSGKVVLENTPFNLKKELDLVVETIQSKINSKNVQFNYNWDPLITKLSYYGDIFRIKQIFLNLLGNSAKFTQKGSIKFLINNSNYLSVGNFEFIIEDTGIGIAKENLKTIFQPFIQENALISQRYGGTGLGLAITKKLIELMKGSIEIQSEKGVGTKFCIKLNLSPYEDEILDINDLSISSTVKNEPSQLETSHQNLMNQVQNYILVAEDDPSGQILMSTFLKKLNYHFDIVSNGEEVIEKLKENKYDLILMDIQMPKLDGLETTKIIRKNGNSIPIVALTAHAMEEHHKMVMDAGMNGHLTKPIDKNKLKQQIDSYLN